MRQYLIGSWANADGYDYSGEMLMGNRNGASRRVHWNPDGSACVASYGDDEPKTSKVSIKDKILPQGKRLQTLRSQMVELEQSYKAGEMDISEYSILRDCVVAKLQRAEILYKKAISVKPTRFDDEYADEMPEVDVVYGVNSSVSPTIHTSTWVDDLPASNSLKLPLQKTLQVVRMLVRLSHKAGSYWQELKEV